MSIKIGYLIVREELFSPLVQTQVLDMLSSLDRKKYKSYVIWACRLDYYFKNKNQYLDLKKKLNSYNIEIIRIPIIVLKFPLSKKQLQFVSFQTIKLIETILKRKKLDILHARGYTAGYIIAQINKRKKNEVKTVFDARSPYLTEIETTYGVNKDSKKYRLWKNKERFIVENTSVSVAVSDVFKKYLQKYDNNVVHIPNNANAPSKESILRKTKIQKRNVICYVGSIGYGWNDIRIYGNLTKLLNEKFPEIKFEYYVMPKSIQIVKKEFNKLGIPEECYSVSTEKPEDIRDKIAGSLCGLQIMSRPDFRMGIKTVDYLSAGVPIICNKNAMGCAEIVENYNVGICIDQLEDRGLYDFVQKQMEDNEKIVKRCIELVDKNYSTKSVASSYETLYENILNMSLKDNEKIIFNDI